MVIVTYLTITNQRGKKQAYTPLKKRRLIRQTHLHVGILLNHSLGHHEAHGGGHHTQHDSDSQHPGGGDERGERLERLGLE